MGGDGLDVADGTTLGSHEIPITHQRDGVTLHTDDAVDNVTAVIHQSKYDIAYIRHRGLLQDDALLAADDKRQHATSIDGQRHTDPLFYQPDGFFQDVIVVWHKFAAS